MPSVNSAASEAKEAEPSLRELLAAGAQLLWLKMKGGPKPQSSDRVVYNPPAAERLTECTSEGCALRKPQDGGWFGNGLALGSQRENSGPRLPQKPSSFSRLSTITRTILRGAPEVQSSSNCSSRSPPSLRWTNFRETQNHRLQSGPGIFGKSLILLMVLLSIVAGAEAQLRNETSRFPIWAAGSNVYGGIGIDTNRGVSVANPQPEKVLDYSITGVGEEVVLLSAGRQFVIVQTVQRTCPADDTSGCSATCSAPATGAEIRQTFGWGDNLYGQLGFEESAGQRNVVPQRISRAMFPSFVVDPSNQELGNVINEHNNRFAFTYWSNGELIPVDTTLVTGTELGKARGLLWLQERMNSIILDRATKANAITLEIDPDTDNIEVNLWVAGLQLNFTSRDSVWQRLGFNSGFLLPALSLTSQIDASLGNNRLYYNIWGGGIRISSSNKVVRYRSWVNATNESMTFEKTLVENTFYASVKELTDELNAFAQSNGHPAIFQFGDPDRFYGKAVATLAASQHEFVIDLDEFDPDGSMLGFGHAIPDTSLYPSSGFPNEISPSALNNKLSWKFASASNSEASDEMLTLDTGLYRLNSLQNAISSKLSSQGRDPDAFQLYIDSDDYVILEIAATGFMFKLGGSMSVGQYLGFNNIDFPTHLTSDPNCTSGSTKLYTRSCGLTDNNSPVRSKATAPRPLVSEYAASGTCDFGGWCTCKLLGSSAIAACIDLSTTNYPTQGCSCSLKSYYYQKEATRTWGSLMEYNITYPNGIYDFAQVRSETSNGLARNGHSPWYISFSGTSNKRFAIEMEAEYIQVDFSRSNLGSLLGFLPQKLPGNFTGAFPNHEARFVATSQSIVLGASAKKVSDRTGDYVVNVATGEEHTLVLTNNTDGEVRLWSMGSNKYGQLGTLENDGTDNTNAVPLLVPPDDSSGFNPMYARQIYAGGHHSAVVDKAGELWLFGRNNFGQLSKASSTASYRVPQIFDKTAIGSPDSFEVSLGHEHSVILSQIGNRTVAYTFGSNRFGQLARAVGLSDHNPGSVDMTYVIPGENDTVKFTGFCAGGAHSVFSGRDGRVWSAGLNSEGQLGVQMLAAGFSTAPDNSFIPNINSISVLREVGTFETQDDLFDGFVNRLSGTLIASVACGRNHTLLRALDGTIWAMGLNHRGQLMNDQNLGNLIENPRPLRMDRQLLLNGGLAPEPNCRVWAAGDMSFIQSFRDSCKVGEFAPDAIQPCSLCQAGKFGVMNATTSCIDCAVGKFSDVQGTSFCELCPIDTYANSTGLAECIECPEEKPGTTTVGMTSIDNCTIVCPPGFSSPTGTPPCTACDAGTFASVRQSFECAVCAIGTYQPSNSSSTCITCPQQAFVFADGSNSTGPTSTITNSSSSLSLCRQVCFPGYAGDSYGLGRNVFDSGIPCQPCIPGSFSDIFGSSACTDCSPDSFQNSSFQTSCLACPEGHGTDGGAHNSSDACFKMCSEGDSSPNGLESPIPCEPCVAGKFADSRKQTACGDCAAGKFSAVGNSSCTNCAPGKYSNFSAGGCLPCDSGTYQDLPGQASCIPCAKDFYQNSTGQTACVECPAEQATENVGSNEVGLCLSLCAAGKYSVDGLTPFQTTCSVCLPGSVPPPVNNRTDGKGAVGNSTDDCRVCPKGSYALPGFSACQLCPAGQFANQTGTANCSLCPTGFSTDSSEGAIECSQCRVGSYASTIGSENCTLCELGKFQDQNGQTSCVACLVGYHAPHRGLSACVGCEAGFFADIQQLSACFECPNGTFSSDSGAAVCDNCAPGYYGPVPRLSSCSACDPGKFNPFENATACADCPAGSASRSNATACTTCSIGTYSTGVQAECTQCNAGYTTNETGAVSEDECLKACLRGEFGQDGLADIVLRNCSRCPAGYTSMGYVSPTDYATACSICAGGSFAGTQGSEQCFNCSAGDFSSVGATVCLQCPPGKFSGLEGSAVCEICDYGKISSQNSSSECMACPEGYYADMQGMSVCTICPPGTSSERQSISPDSCRPSCPPGTFGEEAGINTTNSTCQTCPIGKFNLFYKQTQCLNCPAGKYKNSTGGPRCDDCPRNFWNDQVGATVCFSCPPDSKGVITETVYPGADSKNLCRVFNEAECTGSSRSLGVYPVYGSGDNSFGQSLGPSYTDDDGVRLIDPQVIKCSSLGNVDPIQLRVGGEHTFVQTARKLPGSDTTDFQTAMWSVGSNIFGQLGISTNAGAATPNNLPNLVPMFLFPSFAGGNLISASEDNNIFSFWRFNSTSVSRQFYSVTIPDGYYGPEGIFDVISTTIHQTWGFPEGIFSIDVDQTNQAAALQILVPGFQADFTQGQLRKRLGQGIGTIPSNSTLNEISASAANNLFQYRIWCGDWPSCNLCTGCTDCGACYRTVTIQIPDGLYTLAEIQNIMNEATRYNGDGETVFLLDLVGDRVKFSIFQTELLDRALRIQAVFTHTGSVGDFLGFDQDVPAWGPTNSTIRSIDALGSQPRPWLHDAGAVDFQPFTASGAIVGQRNRELKLGGSHTVVQTWDDGFTKSRLWAFGSNLYGQLGVDINAGSITPNFVPLIIPTFDEFNGGLRAIQFEAGGDHTFVQDSGGNLRVFGSNQFGQLGLSHNSGTTNPIWMPTMLSTLNLPVVGLPDAEDLGVIQAVSFSLGIRHTVLEVRSNYTGKSRLYAFGSNQFGQLGSDLNNLKCFYPGTNNAVIVDCDDVPFEVEENPDPVPNWQPQQIDGTRFGLPENWWIEGAEITIGSFSAGGEHTLVLTPDQVMNDVLYCVGSNQQGQCGTSCISCGVFLVPLPNKRFAQPNPNPMVVETGYDDGVKIVYVAAGYRHSVVGTNDNRFWSFGVNADGQLIRNRNLGLATANPDVSEIPPTAIGFGKQPFIGFQTGSEHSLLQTFREYCALGNHSVDTRTPCNRCEPGSFTGVIGTRTFLNLTESVDQNYFHPYVGTAPPERDPTKAVFLSCEACGAGNFSAIAGSSSCGICIAGKYSFSGASTCHNCFRGTFSNSNMTGNCSLCQPGTSSLSGQTACFDCPAGKFAAELASPECSLCAPGFFLNGTRATACARCPANTYQDKFGQVNCTQCQAGKLTASDASDEASDCTIICARGKYGDAINVGDLATQNCRNCSAGFFAPEIGQTACDPCPPGEFRREPGKSFCLPCAPGHFSTGGATSCEQCLAGTFSNGTFCAPCPPGRYALENNTRCIDCEHGKFSNQSQSSFCYQCKDGFFTTGGQSVCEVCPAGKYGLGGHCFNCSAGYHSAHNASTSCDACPAGKFSLEMASVCELCAFGSANGQTNASACVLCAPGFEAESQGQSACDACPPGSSTDNQTGAASCIPCLPGFFAASPATPACSFCLPGSFSVGNVSVCTDCALGSAAPGRNSSVCTDCALGSFAGETGLSACLLCPAGTFGNYTGMTVCSDCFLGTASSQGSTVCEDCIPGTHAPNTSMPMCILCDVGFYSPDFRSINCTACPNGLSTKGKGAGENGRPSAVPEFFNSLADCQAECPAGTFNIFGVQPDCIDCPGGYVSRGNGSTSCDGCIPGQFAPAGQSICSDCASGTFSQSAKSVCTRCSPGSFQDATNASACDLCAASTYSASFGASVCDLCPFRITDNSNNLIYYKDCRFVEACSNISGSGVFFNQSGVANTGCCDAVTTGMGPGAQTIDYIESIDIGSGTEAEVSLGELEAIINAKFLEKVKLSNFLRLELNEVAWSEATNEDDPLKYLTLHVQYGGFQLVFDPTATTPAGELLGYPVIDGDTTVVYVPASGPTACYAVEDGILMDGGCYSAFSITSPDVPESLVTEQAGSTTQNLCESFCVAGKYNVNEGIERTGDLCENCNGGNFSGFVGQSSCDICAPGSYTPDTLGTFFTVCTNCEVGKFQHEYGQSSCIFCPLGKFAPFTGLSSCETCPAGTFSVYIEKDNGNITRYPDTCIECNPGYATPHAASQNCSACPAGRYAGFAAATFCFDCEAGKFSDKEASAACTDCEAGTRSSQNRGSITCVDCNDGEFSNAGQSFCGICQPGTISLARAPACTPCAPGSYQDQAGQSSCLTCLPGTFSLSGQSVCTQCSPGGYQDKSNSTSCIACSLGSFSSEPASLRCDLCEYGSYANSTNMSSCLQCEYTQNTTGVAKTSPSDCITRCVFVQSGFAGYNGVEPCTICPGGTNSSDGICVTDTVVYSQWTDTGRNESYPVNGTCSDITCPDCPPGSAQYFPGQTFCEICPPSTYSVGGQLNCTVCPAGTQTAYPGATSASLCLDICFAGFFGVLGQAPCTPCAAGTFSATSQSSACEPCALGFYQPLIGQTSCIECPAGRSTLQLAAPSQEDCLGIAPKNLTDVFCDAQNNYVRDFGSTTEIAVINGGTGYVSGDLDLLNTTSTGFDLTFAAVAGTVVNASGVIGSGHTSSTTVELYFAGSSVVMSQSVTDVRRKNFVDLVSTPDSFLQDCRGGFIDADTETGSGFSAAYEFNSLATTRLEIPSLPQHGTGYTTLPRIKVSETSIVNTEKVADSVIHSCGMNGTVEIFAFGGGVDGAMTAAGGFVGSAVVSNGTFTTISILDRGVGYSSIPSLYPSNQSSCRCGTGIGQIQVMSPGSGYPASTFGIFSVENPSGSGFEATFTTDSSGGILEVTIVDAGAGFTDSAIVRACPRFTVWNGQCCFFSGIEGSDPFVTRDYPVGCQAVSQPILNISMGYPSGVPGAFDSCIRAKLDPTSCHCGSSFTSLSVTSPGSGYLPGNLGVFRTGCLNDAEPGCSGEGQGFSGNFTTDISICDTYFCNNVTGGLETVTLESQGTGYRKSRSTVKLVYDRATFCDNGTNTLRSDCPQDSTITFVQISAEAALPLAVEINGTTGYLNTTTNGTAVAFCENQQCTGDGFRGTCTVSQGVVQDIEIINHGTGYNSRYPPVIACNFLAVQFSGSNSEIETVVGNYVFYQTIPELTITGNYTGPAPTSSNGTQVYFNSSFTVPRKVFSAVVAGGATIESSIGSPSGALGSSDACFEIERADGEAVVEIGPLKTLETRILGTVVQPGSAVWTTLSLNQETLNDGRLFWFLKNSLGYESLVLDNAMCVANSDVYETAPGSGRFVHRSVECTGKSRCADPPGADDPFCVTGQEEEIWDTAANMTVIFFEVQEPLVGGGFRTETHISFLKIGVQETSQYFPFADNLITIFHAAPADSWIHALGFGGDSDSVDIVVHASTLEVIYMNCLACRTHVPSKNVSHFLASTNLYRFPEAILHIRNGFAFTADNARVLPGPANEYKILGLENIFPSIPDGTMRLTVDGYLPVSGCEWPSTQEMRWTLTVKGFLDVKPHPAVHSVGPSVVSIVGLSSSEHFIVNSDLNVSLAENRGFLLRTVLTPLAQGATREFEGVGTSSDWVYPFGARWLTFDTVNVRFEAEELAVGGLNITLFTFDANGTATLLDDPWTRGGPGEQVRAISVGSSGRQFPHILAETNIQARQADPAAVVRTIVQEAMALDFSNPVCGTVASQDLAFKQKGVRFVFSTWSTTEFQSPSLDVRSYNCITQRGAGSAPSGTPCHFPFQYNGQVFTQCTSQGWTRPWCATTPVYNGQWGECVCDRLRRGIFFEADVQFSKQGPLNTTVLREFLGEGMGSQNLLQGGLDVSDVNGTLEVYFPWFDSSSSNDLELLVLVVPNSSERCVVGNYSKATVSSAPSGQCEKLGFVTEWMGTPGDENFAICRPPSDVFPGRSNVNLLTAATEAMGDQTERVSLTDIHRSVASTVELQQPCIDSGLARELSLCAAEKFRNIPVADPHLFGRQFCFWTDTSDFPGFSEHKFSQCASCSGRSCTTNYPPLRAWQLQDQTN